MRLPILICDDSNMARKQMARSLPLGWDVEITLATNGQEGLDAIKAGKGDIVFLDLNMPVMDGYEVLEAIQKQDLPALVIVVSGDIQPQAYERVKQLGALDFINKPTSKEKITDILHKYGIVNPEQLAAIKNPPAQYIGNDELATLKSTVDDSNNVDITPYRDSYQEVANVAMGRAANLLARMIGTFIHLPIPNVNMLETSELHMALSSIEDNESMSAVCQGFIGAGVSGEALLLFRDSAFTNMAQLMGFKGELDDHGQLEVLMDVANILIGAYLKAISEQLDMNLAQGQPVVLGQHLSISELITRNTSRWQRTLAIEINYQIESFDIKCDLLILITEDSLTTLNNKVGYLFDEEA
ncbi:response regulator [Alginatibacterium sediminis]|uniref:Response regulator n=1 Tax=Alginatibacterium sediminis TaxID=2164068 RepID=A0A420EG07_9ALTE|nr:response regulator [Alginatibacterium sediminis]RKF19593.1 response regulator [Alginatibacterium sediminis]